MLIKITRKKQKNIVVGCIYRHPSKDCANFHDTLKEQLCNLNNKGKEVFVLGDIQLFQLTLSVQSMKIKDKTERLRGIFMNKFIKISHAWRKQ